MILASLAAHLCIAAAAGTGTGSQAGQAAATPASAAAKLDGQTTPTAAVREAPSTSVVTDNLVIKAGGSGSVTIRETGGRIVEQVELRAGETASRSLPPGHYIVTDDRGSKWSIEIENEGVVTLTTASQGPAALPPGDPSTVPAMSPDEAESAAEPICGRAPCRRWRRIAAPVMSAMLPGSGQIVNNEPGKGIGMFLGALVLGGGAAALRYTQDPLDNSTPGLGGTTFASEVVSSVGFGVLSGGLSMLYAAQIMDAYASAAGKERPNPETGHRVAFQLRRMATVGYRAGDPAAAFFADWNLNFLVQVRDRFSVGLSDLSLKAGGKRTTIQGGARLHYRFYDRGRLWMGAGLGTMLQGTVGRRRESFGESTPPAVKTNAFSAIPYGELDLRLFLLDRWSLDLVPRISVPLGTRFYREGLALPAYSVTFELGTGVGVYF